MRLIDLDTADYCQTLRLQEKLVEEKLSGSLPENQLIMVEHSPVFTLGNRGGLENLKVSADFLQQQHIEVIQTRRGGDITYHGPGQLVAYPIIHLRQAGISVPQFIKMLEEIMIKCAAFFGIAADRAPENHGVWVNGRKLGSLGIALRRSISYHGLALNLCPDLTPFSWINPCGLNTKVTSISLEKKWPVSVNQAKEVMIKQFIEIFPV